MASHVYFTLDADGEPVPAPDLSTWVDWFEDACRDPEGAGLQVANTYIEEGDVTVSTVFLNHSLSGSATPRLFETMIFGGPHSERVYRYTSRAEAQRGHDAVVAALRAGVPPDLDGRAA